MSTLPKELYLSPRSCVLAGINAKGQRRRFAEDRIAFNYYYNLQCLLNGHNHMIEILYPEIQVLDESPKYLKKMIKIAETAEEMGVKLLSISDPLSSVDNTYVAYISEKERIKALTYKYFKEVVKVPGENKNGKITEMPYIAGVLFGYSPEDIRGYYLRIYLLKGLPDKFKKPLEELEEADGNNFVQPDQFYDRRYKFVKDADNFKDFDTDFEKIKKRALDKLKKVSESPDFKKFAKKHVKDIKNYKYNHTKMFPKE